MKRIVMGLMLGAVFAFSSTVLAAEAKAAKATKAPAKKVASAKSKKKVAKSTAPAEPSPAEVQSKAVASCQKHVESMLHESAETKFSGDSETRVTPATADEYDVAGWVTSKNNAGQQKHADFNCHAKRYGMLWTTKTSMDWK